LKLLGLVIVFLSGAFLLYATADFPPWADPASPASMHVSPRYIEKSLEETAVPNVVTSVLADYRGFDTMFETTVIFVAGVVCFVLLRIFKTVGSEQVLYRHTPTGITVRIKDGRRVPPGVLNEFESIDTLWTPYDFILKTMCRLIIPFIQLFALYVIAHGHHSPGGGFQGGVILGASFILLAISQDLRSSLARIGEKIHALLCPVGVFTYAGTGALCLLLGQNFLDYKALSSLLGVDGIMARSHGIFIVEVGVGIAVMATMVWIYNNLSSEGRYDEGL
jgi:multicomponent Na+:H+ antiporter subunit B